MLEILERSSGELVGVKASGRVTRQDFARLMPRLEETIARYGSVCLLCDVTGWAGLDPGALWEDLRLTLRHGRDVERMAVAVDRCWIERWVGLVGKLVGTEARCFEPGRREQAWAWLREDTPG